MALELKEGGFYRTRDGKRIGPAVRAVDYWYLNGVHYSSDGKSAYKGILPRSKAEAYREREDLVAEWTEGPVREVTRKEIVKGYFGGVEVTPKGAEFVGIRISNLHGPGGPEIDMGAAELRAAAATFIELADALEGK